MPDPLRRRYAGRPRALAVTPAAGAAVMSSAILSVALQIDGVELLSRALLAVAILQWLVLAGVFLDRLVTERATWRADADAPPALTSVAATAVIGARFALLGDAALGWVLLVASAALWLLLTPLVLGGLRSWHEGAAFLSCVATQGLAVLLATLARPGPLHAVTTVGFVLFALGLGLYLVVLSNFDWHQLAVGAGDHWVLAGALAISSLAGAKLILAQRVLGTARLGAALTALDLTLWSLSVLAYGVLVVAEIRSPRLRYDVRRWATVFPLGMTAAATYAVAQAEGLPGLRLVGDVLVWPAFLAWALTAYGACAQVRRARGSGGR